MDFFRSKMKAPLLYLQVVLLVLGTVSRSAGQSLDNGDCAPYRILNGNATRPCLQTTGKYLARNVNCFDDIHIEICCRNPVRQFSQQNSQIWFRIFTLVGRIISSSCTKRLLCDQACLEGLNFQPISHFPQPLSAYSNDDQEFAQAYMNGEGISCYNNNLLRNDDSSEYYAMESVCNSGCRNMNPGCDSDMKTSTLIGFYYRASSIVHNLEMFIFTVVNAEVKFYTEAGRILGQALNGFFSRVREIKSIFSNLFTGQQSQRLPRQVEKARAPPKLLRQMLTR